MRVRQLQYRILGQQLAMLAMKEASLTSYFVGIAGLWSSLSFQLACAFVMPFRTELYSPNSVGCSLPQHMRCKTYTRMQAESEEVGAVSMGTYKHDDYWKVSFRESPPPRPSDCEHDGLSILCIHPVGIGLSSWFWERVMLEMNRHQGIDGDQGSDTSRMVKVYAPNLIGCGTTEGSDPWDPDVRGLSFPLGWVQGCETLIRHIEKQSTIQQQSRRRWVIVAQGGLAPVGVLLASRNPQLVEKLVLASPPPWKDMTTPIPQIDLKRNYNSLRNPLFGDLAFRVLESRWAIEFFSNQFLFSEPCDDDFLRRTLEIACVDDRAPVQAFNAGLCQHRSYQEELCSLDETQSTLIVAGLDDKRTRNEYLANMKNCFIQKIPGTNVLPWESPREFARALKKFTMMQRMH